MRSTEHPTRTSGSAASRRAEARASASASSRASALRVALVPWALRWLLDTGQKSLALLLCCTVAFTPLLPYATARADDRPAVAEESSFANDRGSAAASETVTAEPRATGGLDALSPEAREAISGTELEAAVESGAVDPADVEAALGTGDGATPISLPGGETRDTVSASAIELPDAEGSVEGMGESFSPILSSGTGTFSVPIAVAPGRAGVQPSLSLAYSSSGGNSCVGFGWGLGVPYISRQTDRGLPNYDDRSLWHPNEDRFIYNGGQELVPVDTAAVAAIEAGAANGGNPALVPADVRGWQQYRARVEGGFMRFFRGPIESGAIRRWVVQSPDGTRFDFGLLTTGAPDADSASSLEIDDEGGTHVFRWMLTRMSDAHGSTIYYHYRRDAGQLYLDTIHYLSPASCGAGTPTATRNCTAPLASYGARVRLVYEGRDDAFTTYTSGYPITTALRLRRVEVTSREPGAMGRSLVRRYHLRYRAGSFHSLLESVQVEGRPSRALSSGSGGGWDEGVLSVAESSLSDAIVGQLLPPMRFGYSSVSGTSAAIEGFGSLSNTVVDVRSSPAASIDEARTELFDVNSDGLLDVIVTDPARYRTSGGAPAVGVFFNGFTGDRALPAPRTPGTGPSFSAAVPVPMASSLSGTLNLGNLNVVPMDIDGDGRGDLLHMPRLSTYGWFTPTRAADPASGPSVSPADQGWRWSYAEINLPRGDLDPRIDLGRDGARIQTLDVNGDHLIDVVRTTGTVMQTWLNLGWLPGGDGRFGSYTRSDSGSVTLSTLPYESCLLSSTLPIDFEDPEVRFADMNADGMQDIVRIRRGRVQYWPGRGLGSWGTGDRACPRGEGADRYVEMETPPLDLDIDLAGVQLADVDGDGASDLVQIGFDRISVWFNRAGRSWTERTIVTGTPAAPSFAARTRLVDIDGSGTLDVLYGDGRSYRYVDLLDGTTPRLLTSVDNGLGALTSMTYAPASEDYLRDLEAARGCGSACESFAWGRVTGEPSQRLDRLSTDPTTSLYRANGTPVLSTVVRSVSTTDRFDVLGREAQVTETRFAYHDGYYEGIEQEFRGFGAADSITVGDDDGPSVLTRTWFHQGRRPANIADDRLAWNPDEALKGREYLTEVFDEEGTFLSTSHASLTTRRLYAGLDGRPVQYAFVFESNEIRYDTTPFTPASATLDLPSVRRERVSATGAVSTDISVPADPDRRIAVRGARPVRIRATWDEVDNLGHVLQQTAHGRATVPGAITGLDDHIVSHTTPVLWNSEAWIWRTERSFVTGTSEFDGSTRYGDTTNSYNAVGDLTSSTTDVAFPSSAAFPTPRTYAFAGDANGSAGYTQTAQDVVASSVLDVWGQPLASCAGAVISAATSTPPAGCLRYSRVVRETEYAQLVVDEIASTSPTSTLTVHATWDRGLGVLLTMTDPNELTTEVFYDGLGRMTALVPPAATGCPDGVPTTRIRYELTPNPELQPLSRVVTTTELDCDDGVLGDTGDAVPGSSAVIGGSLTSIGYVDGLGRARAALATGPDVSGARRWVRSGLSRFSRKGEVIEAFQPDFYGGSDTVLSQVVAINPRMPSSRAVYDAFGRARYAFAEDGSLTVTSYHALSTDVCDPLDNDPSSPHSGTCTTARTDGHGRLIDQILRNRPIDNPFAGLERHRLWTFYRADGAVVTLVRAQTTNEDPRPATRALAVAATPSVHRDFFYDSISRRIGSDDPDTDDPTNSDPASRTWRYLFNRVGDLVAVRDPRGCGQNFFYDLGGRLLGEEYVSCGEAQSAEAEQPAYDIPGDAIALGPIGTPRAVDVAYFYDEYPDWVGTGIDPPVGASGVLGRATGVADRGQRSAVAYDDRGNAIWTARQMAFISAAIGGDSGAELADGRPTFAEGGVTSGTLSYDESHTYVRTATFDHAARPTTMTLPDDPDWDPAGTDPSPPISGRLEYDRRGLPARALLSVGSLPEIPVVAAIEYLRDGLVSHIEYGELSGSPVIESFTDYDVRRRPVRMSTTRTPDPGALAEDLQAVSVVHDQRLEWDAASNLTALVDERLPIEWPAGFRPQTVEITHDSLYRVVGALFHYSTVDSDDADDTASDWRSEAAASNAVDPMRPEPAAMVGTPSTENRVRSLTWEWDWLGNMTEWTDDAQQFYERSIGAITNGQDVAARPSALYVSSNLEEVGDGGGWVEVDYGDGGNVTRLTVHGECVSGSATGHGTGRVLALSSSWVCATEQHFEYRWDELNRIVEARRWDRDGAGAWTFEARQRYRYDGANQRTVKESFDTDLGDSRVALYVYPGDFERRGLTRGAGEYEGVEDGGLDYATETQYLVAGARLVWDHAPLSATGDLDRNRRLTMGVSDLIGTTAASVDLLSGELLEVSTYYPNGARETLRTSSGAAVPLEPMGFTGKEADEDVGLVYFGERYLLARLGRWASADPLHVHASGGGEALNSYHYVGGSLLEAKDPLGLDGREMDAGLPAPPGTAEERDVGPGSGESESFVRIPTPDFPEGTVEDSLEEFDWAIARISDGEGGTYTTLMWGREGIGWNEYRPGLYDGRVEHDPWGQAAIDAFGGIVASRLAGALGAGGEVLGEVAASGAGAWTRSLWMSRVGVWRFTPTGLRRVSGAIAEAGDHAVVHGSGLISRVITGTGGRIEHVAAVLRQEFLYAGTHTDRAARALAHSMGYATDDAGHAIAFRLGGDLAANIFPQLRSVNRGMFAQLEGWIASQVDDGADVSVHLVFEYADDAATRAVGVTYNVTVNGTAFSIPFIN